MKSRFGIVAFAAVAVVAAAPDARSAPRRARNAPSAAVRAEDSDRNVSTDIPQSRLQALAAEEEPLFQLRRLELRASFIQAPDLNLDSRVPDAGAFHTIGIPAFDVGLYFPFYENRYALLSLRTGPGFALLKRSGTYTIWDRSYPGEQTLSMLSASAGVHVLPKFLQFKGVYPQAGFSAVPMFALSSESELNPHQSVWAMRYDLNVGAAVSLPWIWATLRGNPGGGIDQGPELTADLIENYGSLAGQTLRAEGFALGARLVF